MIAFVHFHTGNWGEGSRLLSSSLPPAWICQLQCFNEKEGVLVLVKILLEGSTVVGITWKNASKCVMHSFILLLYVIAADDGDHKKPSQTIHSTFSPGKEKTYIYSQGT